MTTRGGGPTTGDRVRYLVAQNLAVAVGVCLLLAVLGGFVAAGELTGPDETTETRVAATWTTDGVWTHGAVVRNGTTAFERGAILRNRTVYFERVTPVLNGSYAFEHSGDPETATVNVGLELVVRAVEDDTVLWDIREDLPGASGAVGTGERFRVPFELNVTAQRALADRVQNELGTSRGTVEVLVIAEADVTATLDGERTVDNRTAQLTITPSGADYTVARDAGDQRSETRTEQVTVPADSDPIRGYGGALVALVALAGAGALVWADREGRLAVPPAIREELRHRRERDSFEEWISEGTVPNPGDGERVVGLNSLEDLVDVAIDSDRRVIADDDRGEYVVMDGDTRYVYGRGVTTTGEVDSDPLAPSSGTDAGGDGPSTSTDGADSPPSLEVGRGVEDGSEEHDDDEGADENETGND